MMLLTPQQCLESRDVQIGKRTVVDRAWPVWIAQPVARERCQQLPDRTADLGFGLSQVMSIIEQRNHGDLSHTISSTAANHTGSESSSPINTARVNGAVTCASPCARSRAARRMA